MLDFFILLATKLRYRETKNTVTEVLFFKGYDLLSIALKNFYVVFATWILKKKNFAN